MIYYGSHLPRKKRRNEILKVDVIRFELILILFFISFNMCRISTEIHVSYIYVYTMAHTVRECFDTVLMLFFREEKRCRNALVRF